jgi:hypothetical protein
MMRMFQNCAILIQSETDKNMSTLQRRMLRVSRFLYAYNIV